MRANHALWHICNDEVLAKDLGTEMAYDVKKTQSRVLALLNAELSAFRDMCVRGTAPLVESYGLSEMTDTPIILEVTANTGTKHFL